MRKNWFSFILQAVISSPVKCSPGDASTATHVINLDVVKTGFTNSGSTPEAQTSQTINANQNNDVTKDASSSVMTSSIVIEKPGTFSGNQVKSKLNLNKFD